METVSLLIITMATLNKLFHFYLMVTVSLLITGNCLTVDNNLMMATVSLLIKT